ncbi:MAG: DUF1003 domain-containing protein [Rhodospirillaceae bacterium]
MDSKPEALPAHMEESVQAIAKLYAAHEDAATGAQRFINRLTDLLGRPLTVAALTIAVAGWIWVNAAAIHRGTEPMDPPPFAWLAGTVATAGMLISVLILAAQRHAGQLAARRERLSLQLALLSEQKNAKIIQLLEEMRRDSPIIANRVDAVAAAMSEPADAESVLDAMEEASEGEAPGP